MDAFLYIFFFPYFSIFLSLFTKKKLSFFTMADINQIATAFTKFYYETFDHSRQELTPLYVS